MTLICIFCSSAQAADTIPVADAAVTAAFYADSSCLLTIDSLIQQGTTVIDADVDDQGSRMFLHCDTDKGRRLSILARGDSLNVAQRVPLLTRGEIQDGEFGMLAWLTNAGVHYSDDSAPRRFVLAGSVKLRKLPTASEEGIARHASRLPFVNISGTLEPVIKQDTPQQLIPIPEDSDIIDSRQTAETESDPNDQSAETATTSPKAD